MKILAIRFARLGDVILLLPALASLKDRFPDSELTLLTGHRCASLAELCPAIDNVIAVDRVGMRDGPIWRAVREMAALVCNVRRKRFDVAVDFHSFRETNLLAWLSGAPFRIGMKRHNAPYWSFCFNRPAVAEDKNLHVTEMFRKVVEEVGKMGSDPSCETGPIALAGIPHRERGQTPFPPPLGRLVTKKAQTPTIALYIDAPVPERIWPPERFAAVADFAIEKLGAKVAVLCSYDRRDLATLVQKASRNPNELSIRTDLTLSELAGVIASSHLLVSNDTGPMHLGPAVGVLTLGLFSIGYPEHFRPTGKDDRYLRGNPIEQIDENDVLEVIKEMWATVDRNLRR